MELSEKLQRLQRILESGKCTQPLYIRFQTTEGHRTFPVISIFIGNDEVQVTDVKNKVTTFDYQKLTDIVAFRDSAGVPVFLSERS
jgi:hypothetical protein